MLPSVVRQVGKVRENNKIYIEDYAYAYLSELKRKKEILPVRVSLYGHILVEDGIKCPVVYGAAADLNSQKEAESQRQAGREFFPEYEHLGYMKLLDDELLPGEKEGCFVFCEENTAMQNYLIACHEKRINSLRVPTIRPVWGIGKYMVQKLVLLVLIIMLAISVSTIDRYQLMQEFAVMVAKAFAGSG